MQFGLARLSVSSAERCLISRLLTHSQICQQSRVRIIHRQQIMACRTVIGDANSCLAVMIPIVTSEAARIIIVAEIIRRRFPGDLHEGKDVCAVDGSVRCGLFDLGLLSVPNRLVNDKKSSVPKYGDSCGILRGVL